MLKRYSQTLFIGLLIFALSGCASVPDQPICAEISLSKGVCTYTVSQKTVIVDDDNLLDGKTWFDIRVKALTVPASSWAAFKAYLIKQCEKTNQCDKDITSWDRNLGL